MIRIDIAAAGLAALIASSGALAQEPRVGIGLLTCTAGGKALQQNEASGIEVVSLACTFKQDASGVEERYAGTLSSKAGKNVPEGNRVHVWVVIAARDTQMDAGVLAQKYAIAAPTGAGQASLVGMSSEYIALQPETVFEDLTVTGVELVLAMTPA